MTNTVPAKLSHKDRFHRRASIAAFIRNGNTVPAACKKFEVSEKTVQTACKENGVKFDVVAK